MKNRIFYSLIALIFWLPLLSAQVKVSLTPSIDLSFPKPPEIFDTLGQKVFNFSDENGYYACIIHRNAIQGNNTPMDLKVYYNNIYKSLQQSTEECKLIKQTDLKIAGILASEFYSTCRENPDFPEIRYKRLFLYGKDLYILDYWTTKAHQASAEQNKSNFLNSFVVHKGTDDAIIPSALPVDTNTKSKTSKDSNMMPIIGIIGVLVLFILWFYFTKKKPKK